MNKKVIFVAAIIILVIICIFVLKNPGYNKVEIPFGDTSLMGIIYIGGIQEDYDYSLVNKYFTTNEFEEIVLGGTEKYLIIPREYEIAVYSVTMNEDGKETETFVKTMNKPFYITCNESDIFSNQVLKITNSSHSYEYSPYISLKDGSLVVENFVTNITK